MTKQERRKARHERRVASRASRRALLRDAGAAVAAVAASIIPFRMVHREGSNHPTWDNLLNHYGRRPEMNRWIRGLVEQPSKPQPALLLVGPECSGKSTFHQAMGLLLPDNAVANYPKLSTRLRYAIERGDLSQVREIKASEDELAQLAEVLKRTWMVVIRGQTECCISLYRRPVWNEGRYLKWCLTNSRDVDPLPNVQRHDLRIFDPAMPRPDLIRRLTDERAAFKQTLLKYAA